MPNDSSLSKPSNAVNQSSPTSDQDEDVTLIMEHLNLEEDLDVAHVELPPPMKIQEHNFGEHLENCNTVQPEANSNLICDKLSIESDDETDDEKMKEKALLKRRCALEELIETEKDYVRDLGLIVDGYMKVMRKEELTVPENLKNGKERIIFGNIEAIYEWHKE